MREYNDLIDTFRRDYPRNLWPTFQKLIERAEEYIAGLKFKLPPSAKHAVVTLCCLKSLDRQREDIYEECLWALLLPYAQEANRHDS